MESVKDILNFCNSSIFYDYTNMSMIEELNQVRKCINNSLYKTIPDSRIRVSLTINDDVILKINSNIENITEKTHDLRENILYMLAFEKLIRDKQRTQNDNDGE